jgi:NAD dependent epimerase/dehydratase family enzyme
VAPELVTNKTLTRTLAQALRKPLILPPVPTWVLKLVQGEASTLLLNSLKVQPSVLRETDFSYDFPTLAETLEDLIRPTS